ncbi:MAG: DUF4884 domain-containing protein [Dysgonomonas sp.]
MKTSRLIVILIALAMFTSCLKKGDIISPEGNKDDFNVTFLFEADGIRVYRFYDGGRYIYFTNKEGKVGYTRSNGKQTYKEETLCN